MEIILSILLVILALALITFSLGLLSLRLYYNVIESAGEEEAKRERDAFYYKEDFIRMKESIKLLVNFYGLGIILILSIFQPSYYLHLPRYVEVLGRLLELELIIYFFIYLVIFYKIIYELEKNGGISRGFPPTQDEIKERENTFYLVLPKTKNKRVMDDFGNEK